MDQTSRVFALGATVGATVAAAVVGGGVYLSANVDNEDNIKLEKLTADLRIYKELAARQEALVAEQLHIIKMLHRTEKLQRDHDVAGITLVKELWEQRATKVEGLLRTIKLEHQTEAIQNYIQLHPISAQPQQQQR
jgi:hypothetical protein